MPPYFQAQRVIFDLILLQVTYYVVDSSRNEGKDYFEINKETGEIFTKVMFDREKKGAYALEVEARDGAPSARPNGNDQPNSGRWIIEFPLNPFSLIVHSSSERWCTHRFRISDGCSELNQLEKVSTGNVRPYILLQKKGITRIAVKLLLNSVCSLI